MTVAELINLLKKFDQGLRVVTEGGCEGELLLDIECPKVVTAHGWDDSSVWLGRFSDDDYLAPSAARPPNFKVLIL